MRYYGAISAAVLVVSISLLPAYSPLLQTFAQPNESVKILITDAIEDLQNNDTSTALTHSHLASQKLSSQGVSSSDSALVLIHDAIQDLLNNDTSTALTHLSLVNEQLELPRDGSTTSAVSLNKTSALNTTLIVLQKENATRPIINQTVENSTLLETENAAKALTATTAIIGTIGDATDQYQYYGDQLIRNGDGAKFLAGEFEVLNDGTIKVDEGARNARLGLDDMNTGACREVIEEIETHARRRTEGYADLNRDMRKKLGKQWDF